MNDTVRQLNPPVLWNHFADINAISRPSKKEEKIISFIKSFGDSLQLQTTVDAAGNVIIKKPATPGMENKSPVILQSHLDMVHQKNSDVTFDFDTQGIKMIVEGDWVIANGTTLGADNGIGVAAIMSVLSSTDVPHPALEALFTIDEETGMTGALQLKPGSLAGNILLNLDTEEDNELTIGCAGGMDVTAAGSYECGPSPEGKVYLLKLKGLKGGHSGVDIHKGRANANKLMNRLLVTLLKDANVQIASMEGGSLRNAIPRESEAIIVHPAGNNQDIAEMVMAFEAVLKMEYSYTDPDLCLKLVSAPPIKDVVSKNFQEQFFKAMYACPNGIYRMSPDIDALVQSSNNVAKVVVKEGRWTVQCLTRSSVDTEKYDLAESIRCSFELAGGKVEYSGDYPGWTPRPASAVVKLMSSIYLDMFGNAPHVNAVHAGLECGILGAHYPEMEMISFGPNIYGAHSPDEKVQVSSVEKFWGYLKEVLSKIP